MSEQRSLAKTNSLQKTPATQLEESSRQDRSVLEVFLTGHYRFLRGTSNEDGEIEFKPQGTEKNIRVVLQVELS